ncbi:hypothetical protein Nos7524_1914 [Nostoc sp. PCC 7524]|uniref:alpha-2,8-polysialyltransferase family protein n=1 Tax=Nostoc sp. (strain ATCC 29411 / PCC 7524) TaxID=28072 RepID=UPI00029F079E|nr:alpha-2,8-polysialyltransferase family protein [Nostoc sp. PCC 7524]AFY47773.1 hypothetical protein Nos7524_1914 [Nostoc sp. PCC 7524]
MKTRFAFVNGIWQLCMVVAAFEQERLHHPHTIYKDYLVVYSLASANTELMDFVEKNSYKFWNWQGVIQVKWVTSEWDRNLNKEQNSAVQEIVKHFDLDSPDAVEEIWLCKIQFRDERFFADIFSQAKIVMYEDGLHTYLANNYLISLPQVNWIHPREALARYKKFVREVISHEVDWYHKGIKRSHLRRIVKFYSVLGTQIPIPAVFRNIRVEYVNKNILQKLFAELNHRFDCQLYPEVTHHHTKTALLIGSNFCHLDYFPRESEVAVFAHVIQKLTAQGYKIFWKEHPRNQIPLFEEFKQIITLDNFVYLEGEQKIPIEVIVSQNKIDLCVSTVSSSLFYLNYIYGIKTLTCARQLLQYLQGDFRNLVELTLQNIEEVC